MAAVAAGVPCHGSRSGVSQRVQAAARRRVRLGEARRVPGEPKSELAARTHVQETRQTQETARDPQAGHGTGCLLLQSLLKLDLRISEVVFVFPFFNLSW